MAENVRDVHRKRASLRRSLGDVCPDCGIKMSFDLRHARTHKYATLDHIVPKVDGGTGALTNLRLCCKSCNSRRGSRPLTRRQLSARNKSPNPAPGGDRSGVENER